MDEFGSDPAGRRDLARWKPARVPRNRRPVGEPPSASRTRSRVDGRGPRVPNDGEEPAALLILFAPGTAGERYFEELAEFAASGRRPTEQEMAELYARHDVVNL